MIVTVTVSNWATLQSACASSGTIMLSSSFVMGAYTSQCDFSGKAIIVRCDGKVLDANKQGRFFGGSGSGSSLEVHGCVLKNGKTSGHVSAMELFFWLFFDTSSILPWAFSTPSSTAISGLITTTHMLHSTFDSGESELPVSHCFFSKADEKLLAHPKLRTGASRSLLGGFGSNLDNR